MAWVSTGTVSVTNGSTTVTGTGTSWFGGLQNGWGFVGPDGRVYEILTVDDAATLTLKSSYQGATASGQIYAAFPTGSLTADLTASLQALIANYQGVYDTVGQGRFPGDVVFDADRDTGMGNPSSNEVALKAGSDWQLRLKAGQASGAAVQAHAADKTDGRLMKNGAHGLGVGTIPVHEGDWDKANASGLFHTDSNGLNKPDFGSNFAGLSLRRNDTLHAEIVVALNSGVSQNARTAVRAKTGADTWSDWFEFYSQTSLIGTVSESGGTPTGAVIERGSNANGEYVRFADGTQICKRQVGLGLRSSSSEQGGLHRTVTYSFGLPASFAPGSDVGASISGDLFPNGILHAVSSNTSQWSVRMGAVSPFVSANCGDVVLTAIGRWF